MSIIFGLATFFALTALGVHKVLAFLAALLVAFISCYWLPKKLEKAPALAEKITGAVEKLRDLLRSRR